MMGPGYWLNPDSGKHLQVSTHDEWIRNPQNAKAIGLPDWVYQDIMKFPPETANLVDEVRKKAMMGGLVRIRNYGNRISVQFMAQRYRNTTILWAVLVCLYELQTHPDEWIVFGNVLTGDAGQLTLAELKRRLENEEPIMGEHNEERDDLPVPPNVPLMRLLERFKNIAAKQ